MLKVLIADDEHKVCQLIEKLVDWEALNMQVVAVAENGIQALEQIREYTPDIAITDIRMPGYDGLELVHLAKEYNPKMEFIIISGYRHFEYAQTAIRYGVSAYLLKPIKKDELQETLKKLGEKLRARTRQLTYEEQVQLTLKSDGEVLRRVFLSDILSRRNKARLQEPLEKLNQEFHYGFQPGDFCMAILKIDGHGLDDGRQRQFLEDKVKSAAARLLTDCVWEQEMTLHAGSFCFLLNFDREEKARVRRGLKALMDEIRVQGSILQDIAVTMSVGTACGEPSGLWASLRNARMLIEERLIAGTGKLMEGEFPAGSSFADSDLFADFNVRMFQVLETLDPFQVRELMVQLKSQMLAARGITGHDILQMTREVCNLYLFFMKNNRIQVEEDFLEQYNTGADNCGSAAELFDYMIRTLTRSFEKAARLKRQDENRPIRVARKYVEEHYGEMLTLEQVSAVAELSPAYLSTQFKKSTGMTFLEYLSRVRMEEAKKLLKGTSRTVADICGQVGYSDVRYFTKSFTKYAGLKPNEYRKLYS